MWWRKQVPGGQQLQKWFGWIQRISGCDTLGIPAISPARLCCCSTKAFAQELGVTAHSLLSELLLCFIIYSGGREGDNKTNKTKRRRKTFNS